MWNATPDGSIIDETGKVLFFSTNRFIDDISEAGFPGRRKVQ
jgi:hypothetical protein